MTIKDLYEWIVSLNLQDTELDKVIKLLGVVFLILGALIKYLYRLGKMFYSFYLIKKSKKTKV